METIFNAVMHVSKHKISNVKHFRLNFLLKITVAPGKASCAQQGGQCTDQCSGLVRSELTECDNVGQQCCVYTF